jgi:hypothetical protein
VLIDDMMRPLCTDWNVYARLRDTARGSDGVQVAGAGYMPLMVVWATFHDSGVSSEPEGREKIGRSYDRLCGEARQGPGRGPRSSTISWTALLAR